MLVSVHALFSTRPLLGSRIIASCSHHLAKEQPKVSHVALLINERWVHESTLDGNVSIISYDKWKVIHTEVARLELPAMQYQTIADLFREIKDKKYDFLGLIYIGLCVIPTYVGLKIPKVNKWQSKTRYFCCEVLGYLTNKDYSMHTPNMILRDLK